MEIFRLFGTILLNDEPAQKGLDEVDKKASGIGTRLGAMLGTAAKWGAGIVAGAGAAAGGLIAMVNNTAEAADEIDKLSERTGINREELQRWKYAAGQSGADIGKLEVGIKTLSDAMTNAVNGNETAVAAFKKLGISVDDLKNKSQQDIFENVMLSLGDLEQGAQRNALGADLLGKSYTELLPLLNAGSDGIVGLKDRADDLGLVMSEDAVKANVAFGDSMDDLKQSFAGVTRGLTNSVLPIVQEFITFLLDNMPTIQQSVQGVFSVLSGAVESILPLLMDIIQNALPPLIDLFTDIATNVLPPVIGLFTDIVKSILPPLMSLLQGLISTILPPVIELLGIIINDILPPFISLFTEVISQILPPLMSLIDQIISTLLPPLIDLFNQIVQAVMPVLIEIFKQFTETVLPPLMELINEVVQIILPPLLRIFNELAKIVLPLVMTVFKALMPVIEPAMNAISAIIKTVLALIKGDWEGVWNGIRDFFSAYLDYIIKMVDGFGQIFGGVFKAIKNTVIGIWDGLVDGIRGGINFIIGGINAFIKGINTLKVPDWVPGVGGKGINLPIIPMLAEGGKIVEEGRVLVGERGPEFLDLPAGATVTPLDKDNGQPQSQIINNNFQIGKMEVRDENDVKLIAQELARQQKRHRLSLGGAMA